jgi:EPS-associated MarR family transcriptional regulator
VTLRGLVRQPFWVKVVASQRKQIQEEIRLRVMRLISCDAEVSSRQVAEVVGISNGSAYYILAALVDKGFVKLSNFKKNTRKGSYAYLLTPKGIREKSHLTLHFIKRKRQEFEDLRAEIEVLEHEAEFFIEEESTLELKK